MQKPIEIRYEEFCSEMSRLINESQLPPFVIEPLLKDILSQVFNQKRGIYQQRVAEYNETILKETKEHDGKDSGVQMRPEEEYEVSEDVVPD